MSLNSRNFHLNHFASYRNLHHALIFVDKQKCMIPVLRAKRVLGNILELLALYAGSQVVESGPKGPNEQARANWGK